MRTNKTNMVNTSLLASYLAIASAITFVGLLASLHVLKPELDPTWRVISEYEIGKYGWLMQAAFLCLVAGMISLFFVLRHHVRTRGGKIGMLLLLLAAFGMFMGGIFVTDPITTSRDAFTTAGILHNIGGSLMIFSTPVLTLLISWSLIRHNPNWQPAKQWLLWPTVMIWLGLAVFIFISTTQYQSAANASVSIGLPNRFFILAYCAWIIIISWQAIKAEHK